MYHRFLAVLSFLVMVLGVSSIALGQEAQAVPAESISGSVTVVGTLFLVLLWCGSLAVAVAEWKLFSNRNQWYLTKGIPLFLEERFCTQVGQRFPRLDSLYRRQTNRIFPPFRFQPLGADEYAFAESLGCKSKLKYGPIMRGHVYFDGGTARIVVKGMMNWFPFALCAAWLFSVGFKPLGLFPLVIVFAFYLCQYIRYRQLLSVIAESWSKTFAS